MIWYAGAYQTSEWYDSFIKRTVVQEDIQKNQNDASATDPLPDKSLCGYWRPGPWKVMHYKYMYPAWILLDYRILRPSECDLRKEPCRPHAQVE